MNEETDRQTDKTSQNFALFVAVIMLSES